MIVTDYYDSPFFCVYRSSYQWGQNGSTKKRTCIEFPIYFHFETNWNESHKIKPILNEKCIQPFELLSDISYKTVTIHIHIKIIQSNRFHYSLTTIKLQ